MNFWKWIVDIITTQLIFLTLGIVVYAGRALLKWWKKK